MCLCSLGASAGTNLQLFYDFGSAGTACANQRTNRVTTTLELFYPDPWGNTFAFVDLDYNINPIDPKNTPFMAYAEIAQVGALDMGVGVIAAALHVLPDAVGDGLSREPLRKGLALQAESAAKPDYDTKNSIACHLMRRPR